MALKNDNRKMEVDIMLLTDMNKKLGEVHRALVGEPEYERIGLIAEHKQTKAKVIKLESERNKAKWVLGTAIGVSGANVASSAWLKVALTKLVLIFS